MSKFRNYDPPKTAPKPLIVGWVPTKAKQDLLAQGREKELPGYWLYTWQTRGPKFLRPLWSRLFSSLYSGL